MPSRRRTQTPARKPCLPSPINKLPSEILSMIFLSAVWDKRPGDLPEPTLSERTKIPLVLSSVNRRWRHVAFDAPRLWTSICIAPDMVDDIRFDSLRAEKQFNNTPLDARHITSFIKYSRNMPLDIYIDARDVDFDFIDPPEMTEDLFDIVLPVLFTPSHMNAALSLLVPHIRRWRSLTILTDTWAPMYEALNVMNEPLLTQGAPLLESLELVRCNDYPSYEEFFSHPNMNKHLFLDLQPKEDHPEYNKVENIFPRLRGLKLGGVHVEWSSLASILTASKCSGLRRLDIASHSDEVRPSLYAFHDILKASPRLESFAIHGTCAALPPWRESDGKIICHDLPPIELPLLRELKLTYRSDLQLRVLASLFHAPNVTHLQLGLDRCPSRYYDSVDVTSSLLYLGTGKYIPSEPTFFVPCKDKNDERHVSFDNLPPRDPLARRYSTDSITLPMFPALTSLVLQEIEAEPYAFHTFFNSLPHLRNLEFTLLNPGKTACMDYWDIDENRNAQLKGLAPLSFEEWEEYSGDKHSYLTTPCPRLKSLTIRGFEFEFDLPTLRRWLDIRNETGADKLQNLEIHLLSRCSKEDIENLTMEDGHVPTVVSNKVDDDTGPTDSELPEDFTLQETKAHELGGVFNDPIYDLDHAEYFARLVLQASQY